MGGLAKLVRGLDPRWAWVGLLVVYGLVYARALGHGFVWDDHSSVEEAAHFEAPLVRGLRSTQHDFLDRSILHDVQLSVPYESYRPLLFLSYSLDDALFGRSAVAMHAHNLLLGMACALLAGWVCSLVLGSSRLGLCAAALFALHPLQTEGVCYVSARGDLLCACFALLASGAFLSSARADEARRRIGLALAASLAFALSLTAKESSAGLPLALAVWALALGRLRQSRPALLGMAAAAVVYAGVRVAIVGAELSRVDRGNALAAIESLPALGLQYLRIFLLPNDLSIERLAAHGGSALLLGWLLLAGLAALGALALHDRFGSWSRSTRTAWAGAAWFYLLLAPATLASESMGVAADRYAVLPILGACVALVALAVQARGSTRGRWVLPAVAAWGGAAADDQRRAGVGLAERRDPVPKLAARRARELDGPLPHGCAAGPCAGLGRGARLLRARCRSRRREHPRPEQRRRGLPESRSTGSRRGRPRPHAASQRREELPRLEQSRDAALRPAPGRARLRRPPALAFHQLGVRRSPRQLREKLQRDVQLRAGRRAGLRCGNRTNTAIRRPARRSPTRSAMPSSTTPGDPS